MSRKLQAAIAAVIGIMLGAAAFVATERSDSLSSDVPSVTRDFRVDQTPMITNNWDAQNALPPAWIVMGGSDLSRDNFTWFWGGVRLWSRNGLGAGFMLRYPQTGGTWTVRSRISPGTGTPTTKVCELLWPDGTGWPPEVDFNESGDRTRSNQTLHYSPANLMHHSTYPIDETAWHTYGVTLVPGVSITYSVDGIVEGSVTADVPATTEWNLHVRTTTNGHLEPTKLDVQSVTYTP